MSHDRDSEQRLSLTVRLDSRRLPQAEPLHRQALALLHGLVLPLVHTLVRLFSRANCSFHKLAFISRALPKPCPCASTNTPIIASEPCDPVWLVAPDILTHLAHLREEKTVGASQKPCGLPFQQRAASVSGFHSGLKKHNICGGTELRVALCYAMRLHQKARHSSSRGEIQWPLSGDPMDWWPPLILLACKYTQDQPFDNGAFAKLAHVPIHTLNRAECALFVDLSFRLSLTSAEFELVETLLYRYQELARIHHGFTADGHCVGGCMEAHDANQTNPHLSVSAPESHQRPDTIPSQEFFLDNFSQAFADSAADPPNL